MKITIDAEGKVIDVNIRDERSSGYHKVLYTDMCDRCKWSEVMDCELCTTCYHNAKNWEK